MFFSSKKIWKKTTVCHYLAWLATLLTWAVHVETLNCDTVVVLLTCQNSSSFKTFRLALPHWHLQIIIPLDTNVLVIYTAVNLPFTCEQVIWTVERITIHKSKEKGIERCSQIWKSMYSVSTRFSLPLPEPQHLRLKIHPKEHQLRSAPYSPAMPQVWPNLWDSSHAYPNVAEIEL